jgi:hypothetical protein
VDGLALASDFAHCSVWEYPYSVQSAKCFNANDGLFETGFAAWDPHSFGPLWLELDFGSTISVNTIQVFEVSFSRAAVPAFCFPPTPTAL